MKDYKVTRPEAAKKIWISLRTLDRYVLKWTIKYKKVKWRVLFSDEDLDNLKNEKNTDVVDEIKTSFNFKKEKKETETFPVFNSSKQEINPSVNSLDLVKITKITSERDTYKKMYEVVFTDLKEKQERLEKINFRLWEVLAKQELPLLEWKKSKEEISILNWKLREDKELINKLKSEISFQKFIKTIFVTLLILTVSILTFWYFYNFKI